MAEKLQEYNNSNLYKLSFEKDKTLINNMHDNYRVGQSGFDFYK
jgi:hypothetical protein